MVSPFISMTTSLTFLCSSQRNSMQNRVTHTILRVYVCVHHGEGLWKELDTGRMQITQTHIVLSNSCGLLACVEVCVLLLSWIVCFIYASMFSHWFGDHSWKYICCICYFLYPLPSFCFVTGYRLLRRSSWTSPVPWVFPTQSCVLLKREHRR